MPKIGAYTGMVKSALKASSYLGVLSPIIKPILSKGIRYFAEDKIKKLQVELHKSVLENNVEDQEGIVAEIEFYKYLEGKENSDAAANIAVNIIFPILKIHDLDKHNDLIDYLAQIGEDPTKEIYPPELMGLLLKSAEAFLSEINKNYKEIVPGLIDALRGLQDLA